MCMWRRKAVLYFHVGSEMIRLRKRARTNHAFESFFFGVDKWMSNQMGIALKSFITLQTSVWSLSCMSFYMVFDSTETSKVFAANLQNRLYNVKNRLSFVWTTMCTLTSPLLEWITMCCLTWNRSQNYLSHTVHLNGFLLLCVFMCNPKYSLCENFLSHMPHVNIFSTICIFMFSFRSLTSVNSLSQAVHIEGFSLVWTKVCFHALATYANVLAQILHVNGLSRVCWTMWIFTLESCGKVLWHILHWNCSGFSCTVISVS